MKSIFALCIILLTFSCNSQKQDRDANMNSSIGENTELDSPRKKEEPDTTPETDQTIIYDTYTFPPHNQIFEGKILRQGSLPAYIIPGDSVSFTFLNQDYVIYAQGGKRRVSEEYEVYVIWNYKLFISLNSEQESISQLIVAHPRLDDVMVPILFAGDIDGDEILDLIIDTSHKYSMESPTLYLSRYAREDEILKIMARHTAVGS